MRPDLREAIDAVLTGGNHLALLIGADHPPYTAYTDQALDHYGPGDRFEIWCAWRSIMRLRDRFRESPADTVSCENPVNTETSTDQVLTFDAANASDISAIAKGWSPGR